MHRALAILLLMAATAADADPRGVPAVSEGDIVFQTSRSTQSVAIQRATHSRWSHMGVVTLRDGKPYVFEAEATVRATPLAEWLARGEGGHYVIKRLADAAEVLTPAARAELRTAMTRFEGKSYDALFEWSDERLYCSELVWKLYQRVLGIRLGEPQRLADFDLTVPEVQRKLAERYGDHLPLDETVISPERIFASSRLVTVVSH